MTDTRTRLLDAAITEIAEHGPHKATVAAIARRAGFTTGAVFGRWPHKPDLIAAAQEHARDRLGEIDADKLSQMVQFIGSVADAMNDPPAARALTALLLNPQETR